jgi:hypothetical protein
MIDSILKGGSSFDWISPVVALIQDLRNGPSVGFNVSMEAGWSTAQLQALLNERGIKLWGMMMVDDAIIFCVRKTQARYAHYVLDRAGVPYQGGLGEATAFAPYSSKRKQERQTSPTSWLNDCLNRVDRFIDNL